MIRRFFCMFVALACLCGTAVAAPYSDWVRLHVTAADGSAAQQALKLEIRDACLKCAAACVGDAPDADSAYMRLEEHLIQFEEAARRRARELGYTGSIRAETGVFHFPNRIYGGVVVPAGEYRALRVTIGGGEGHNWWCVLYPTLCFGDEASFAVEEIPRRRGMFFELFEKWRANR